MLILFFLRNIKGVLLINREILLLDPIPRELARTVFLFSFHRYPLPHIMLGWFDHFPLATMLGDSLQVVNILFFYCLWLC